MHSKMLKGPLKVVGASKGDKNFDMTFLETKIDYCRIGGDI
jgi:hypothetical protein